MPDIVVIESKEELEAEVNKAGDKILIVDFYADWCRPCQMIAPELKIIEKDCDVVVVKVNADESDELMSAYEVNSLPTFVYLKHGKEVTRVVGANRKTVRENVEIAKKA